MEVDRHGQGESGLHDEGDQADIEEENADADCGADQAAGNLCG